MRPEFYGELLGRGWRLEDTSAVPYGYLPASAMGCAQSLKVHSDGDGDKKVKVSYVGNASLVQCCLDELYAHYVVQLTQVTLGSNLYSTTHSTFLAALIRYYCILLANPNTNACAFAGWHLVPFDTNASSFILTH